VVVLFENQKSRQAVLIELCHHRPIGVESVEHKCIDERPDAVRRSVRLVSDVLAVDEHEAALFQHLQGCWQDLFQAQFDVLLYDLTSTYSEGRGEVSRILTDTSSNTRNTQPVCCVQ
jgi:hypothetical protein